MGMGGAMGGVAGFVCAMCAAASAFGAPDVRKVEVERLIPDTQAVSSNVVFAQPARLAAGDGLELDASVQRMMRFGFTVADMHAIPLNPVPLRYGLPVDEQASRDDRVQLTRHFAVGTLMLLQRDSTAFRELGGRQYFREDAVSGIKFFPLTGAALHLGAGALVSMDKYDPGSALFGRPFVAMAQVGVRF